MRKPSVFSKDYEKVMRKRKRVKVVVGLIVAIFLIFLGIKISKINFDNVQNKLQKWVDGETEDKTVEKVEENNGIKVNEEAKEEVKEDENIEKEEFIEFTVEDNKMKIMLKGEGDNKLISAIENAPEKLYYKISPSGKNILVIDSKQNLLLFNAKGESKDLTLKTYIAPDGERFEKENVRSTYDGYIWTANAQFLNDNKIVYISNVPYFGYNLNKYITIVDVESNTHKTLWDSKAKEIILGELKENRLEVTVDGNIRYIDQNGSL